MTSLIIFDTRGIKKFIDDRRYLPEIRRASVLLDNTIPLVLEELGKNIHIQEIYTGGGNALLTSAPENLEYIQSEGVKLFKKYLNNSEMHINPQLLILSNIKASELYAKGQFSHARDYLMAHVGKIKRSFHNLNHIITELSTQVCVSCNSREGIFDTIREQYICEYCLKLIREGNESIMEISSKYNISNKKELMKYQMEFLSGQELPVHKNSARYKIAVVLIDGNLFGAYLSKIDDENRLKQVSKTIDNVVKSIFNELLKELSNISPADACRLELGKIYIGGDDLRLIVPGKLALPIAYQVITRFSKLIKKELSEKLTLSAGIALGKSKTPLSSLLEVGSFLLKSAKSIDNNRGSLDFHTFTSTTDSISVQSFRQRKELDNLYANGFSVNSEFWELMTEILPNLFELTNSLSPEKVKKDYLIPLQEIYSHYLDNIPSKGLEHTLLYTIRQSNRNEMKKKVYGIAIRLLKMKGNSIERAIEVIKMRYEL